MMLWNMEMEEAAAAVAAAKHSGPGRAAPPSRI